MEYHRDKQSQYCFLLKILRLIYVFTLCDNPGCMIDDFINPFTLFGHFDSLPFTADGGTCISY